MMGQLPASQNALFYDFCLEKHIPEDHLLRQIDQLLDFDQIHQHLELFYSTTGRPSIDPELMIRMLLVGYCYGIRSERRLCEEVNFNLAYRWFCRLGWKQMCRIIRASPRTAMAVSGMPRHSGIFLNKSCSAA